MKKLLLVVWVSLSTLFVRADEGMWLLMLINRLNYVDMQKQGLKLTPEEIYSVNKSSLKDAIVSFGGFCTGEVVSDQGLIFTNHHCGYSAIAELSSEENDYLKNGFWAYDKKQELKPKNLYVRFFIRMGDVTNRIQRLLNDNLPESKRQEIIKDEMQKIENEQSENGKYKVVVKSFFNGNEFYYFVYQDYPDVRLVGAPPSSIGKFGGDTDNWEWPRHTGDFCIFRVYADKNGNPAEYSPDNVPLKPKHFLPINLKGIKPGDFAMILGFPGSTNRYMTSYGIEQAINFEYPSFIEASKTAMDVMKRYMDKSDKTRIAYSDNYSSVANYWKNRLGMIEALQKNKVAARKQKLENDLFRWMSSSSDRRMRYQGVLKNIENFYIGTNHRIAERMYMRGILVSSGYATIPYTIGPMLEEYIKQDEKNRSEMLPKIEAAITERYENFDRDLEREIFVELTSLYRRKAYKKYMLETFAKVDMDDKQFRKAMDNYPSNSIFHNPDKIREFLKNPNKDLLERDALYKLSKEMITHFRNKTDEMKKQDEEFAIANRLYMEALMKSGLIKKLYPDANSTIRFTYGTVQPLPEHPTKKNDAKINYYTTLDGTIAKYKPGDEEFDLPQKLMDLHKAKDYGIYADKAGYMPVNFLTNNDITGGNSGSPVINGQGHLIGIAFDGNWEAMSGDIMFEEKLQRTINVDIRYVLFIIDKFAGAKNLINELKIIR